MHVPLGANPLSLAQVTAKIGDILKMKADLTHYFDMTTNARADDPLRRSSMVAGIPEKMLKQLDAAQEAESGEGGQKDALVESLETKVKELQAELEKCRGELDACKAELAESRKDAKPGSALPPPPPPPGETALYSWEVLKEGCPQGVDPKHKELALRPEEYKQALGVEKQDWAGMAEWKKQRQKKAAGLF